MLFLLGSVSSFFLELFFYSSPVVSWTPTDLGSYYFSVISFCLFILFMGFSRQKYWSGLPFPSSVDHVLSPPTELKIEIPKQQCSQLLATNYLQTHEILNWPIPALSLLSHWEWCHLSCWLILPLMLCAPFPTQENLDISVSSLPPLSFISPSLSTHPLNIFRSLITWKKIDLFTIASKGIKYRWINLTNEMEDLHAENYKRFVICCLVAKLCLTLLQPHGL